MNLNPDLYGAKIRRVYSFLIAGIVAFTIQAGIIPQYARATTYDYGVGLSENAYSSGAYQISKGSYCYPSAHCSSFSSPDGIVSASNVLSKSASGSTGKNPAITGSGSATENGLVNMGAIHLESTASAVGAGSGNGSAWGVWSDILTIGNHSASYAPLQFQVTLDLTGFLDAQSQPLQHSSYGSVSDAGAQSYLTVNDIGFGTGFLTNTQSICLRSQNGKTSSPCKHTAFANFSGTLITYPGDHITISDVLYLFAGVDGSSDIYGCGVNQSCFESASGAATSYFLDTSLFTFTPITPGAFYTSASGTVYSGSQGGISATPEPSTWALFGTGILLMGMMAYRRKKVAA